MLVTSMANPIVERLWFLLLAEQYFYNERAHRKLTIGSYSLWKMIIAGRRTHSIGISTNTTFVKFKIQICIQHWNIILIFATVNRQIFEILLQEIPLYNQYFCSSNKHCILVTLDLSWKQRHSLLSLAEIHWWTIVSFRKLTFCKAPVKAAVMTLLNTLRHEQRGRHFPDDIFKPLFLTENKWISINTWLKVVPVTAKIPWIST